MAILGHLGGGACRCKKHGVLLDLERLFLVQGGSMIGGAVFLVLFDQQSRRRVPVHLFIHKLSARRWRASKSGATTGSSCA